MPASTSCSTGGRRGGRQRAAGLGGRGPGLGRGGAGQLAASACGPGCTLGRPPSHLGHIHLCLCLVCIQLEGRTQAGRLEGAGRAPPGHARVCSSVGRCAALLQRTTRAARRRGKAPLSADRLTVCGCGRWVIVVIPIKGGVHGAADVSDHHLPLIWFECVEGEGWGADGRGSRRGTGAVHRAAASGSPGLHRAHAGWPEAHPGRSILTRFRRLRAKSEAFMPAGGVRGRARRGAALGGGRRGCGTLGIPGGLRLLQPRAGWRSRTKPRPTTLQCIQHPPESRPTAR